MHSEWECSLLCLKNSHNWNVWTYRKKNQACSCGILTVRILCRACLGHGAYSLNQDIGDVIYVKQTNVTIDKDCQHCHGKEPFNPSISRNIYYIGILENIVVGLGYISPTRIELLDLEHDRKCDTLGMFPVKLTIISPSAGRMEGGKYILVCGGAHFIGGSRNSLKTCYVIGDCSIKVVMRSRRSSAGSIVIRKDQDQLFMTGGHTYATTNFDQYYESGWQYGWGHWTIHKSTEIVSLKNGSIEGPDLPGPRYRHCFVLINATTALLIGGQDTTEGNSVTATTFFFDVLNLSWRAGPSLNTARKGKYFSHIKSQPKNVVLSQILFVAR